MALDCPINWPNYRAAMAAYGTAAEGEPDAMTWDYVPAYRNYKTVLQTLTFNDAVDAASAKAIHTSTDLEEAHRAACSGVCMTRRFTASSAVVALTPPNPDGTPN